MRCHIIFISSFLAFQTVHVGQVLGEDFPKLHEALKQFDKCQTRASQKLLKAFDVEISKTKRDRSLSLQARLDAERKIRDLKVAFQTRNQLPTDDKYFPLSLAYVDALHKKETKLVKNQLNKLEVEYVKDTKVLRDVLRLKSEWQKKFPATHLTPRVRWHGQRLYPSGNTTDFHLHVGECQYNKISGSVWQAAGSSYTKIGVKVEGRYEGNQIILRTTRSLYGKSRNFDFTGYVIGGRMMLKLNDHRDKRGPSKVTLWKK